VSLTVSFDPLLDYSDHERRKWREWVTADPARLALPVQPGARFPTAGALLDHVFFVERRHLSRLEGSTPPEASGVPENDGRRLFEYGDLVRADLRKYVGDLTEEAGNEIISFNALNLGQVSMSRRRLLTHVLLHEVRHLAQLALAARTAGIEPPGQHDLFFFEDFA
jgi:uncharacterized damage-inducible protein DinB